MINKYFEFMYIDSTGVDSDGNLFSYGTYELEKNQPGVIKTGLVFNSSVYDCFIIGTFRSDYFIVPTIIREGEEVVVHIYPLKDIRINKPVVIGKVLLISKDVKLKHLDDYVLDPSVFTKSYA